MLHAKLDHLVAIYEPHDARPTQPAWRHRKWLGQPLGLAMTSGPSTSIEALRRLCRSSPKFSSTRLLRSFTIKAMVTIAAATKTTSTIPTRAPAQRRVSHFIAITCSVPNDSCDLFNADCRTLAQLVSPSRDPNASHAAIMNSAHGTSFANRVEKLKFQIHGSKTCQCDLRKANSPPKLLLATRKTYVKRDRG